MLSVVELSGDDHAANRFYLEAPRDWTDAGPLSTWMLSGSNPTVGANSVNDEAPKKRRDRRRSPYTACVDSILVQFTATMLPHDSPEFQERAAERAPSAERRRSRRTTPSPTKTHLPRREPAPSVDYRCPHEGLPCRTPRLSTRPRPRHLSTPNSPNSPAASSTRSRTASALSRSTCNSSPRTSSTPSRRASAARSIASRGSPASARNSSISPPTSSASLACRISPPSPLRSTRS